MKKLIPFVSALIFVLLLAGCKNDTPGGEIQVGQLYSFDEITQIKLTNAHNGNITFTSDENDILEITAFVGETVGKSMGSGKGYYEGSYAVTFYYENGDTFSLAFGDSNCFYTGKGNDGHPIRYSLINVNISDDVIPFFSQYDQGGFDWNITECLVCEMPS